MLDWVRTSAKAVTAYYGRFPVSSLRLLLVPVDGARARGGTTWGYRGAAIRIPLGRESTEDDLRRDWVMVHEMVHTALPDLDDRYAWLSEGLAVYVEPIARVQAGDLTAKEIWQAMMRDMPKGLPQAGDEGLDNTNSWGRRYWGGAMFCLLADLEIRKRTGNRFGLQDAMRGVIAAGGNHEQDWSIERIQSTADKAVGVDVLTRLHNEMGSKPVTPDLAALWRDLGLKSQGDHLEFDDTAPLVAIRKAIRAASPIAGIATAARTFSLALQRRMLLSTSCLIDAACIARNSGCAVLTSPAFRHRSTIWRTAASRNKSSEIFIAISIAALAAR